MNPIRLAGCIIRNEDGKILLLHRNKKGVEQWELPGGKLEKGETAQVAAVREIREELGVEITNVMPVGQAAFQENGREFTYSWFDAKIAAGVSPSIREPEAFDSVRYWSVTELRQRSDLSANLKNLLASDVLEEVMDPYQKLNGIVRMLDVRFPNGTDIFQRMSRLAEETGELAQAVNHAEGMGIKREKYGEPDMKELAKEVQDVMRAAIGIAQYYGIEDELRVSIDKAYTRLTNLTK